MTDKEKKCCEKNPNECHCAFRCLGGEFCDGAEKRIKTLQEKLDIVVKALEEYANKGLWSESKISLGLNWLGPIVTIPKSAYKENGYEEACEALAKIQEIK